MRKLLRNAFKHYHLITTNVFVKNCDDAFCYYENMSQNIIKMTSLISSIIVALDSIILNVSTLEIFPALTLKPL